MPSNEIPAPKIRYIDISTEEKSQRGLSEFEKSQKEAQKLKGDSREQNGFFAGEVIEIE